MHSRHSEAGITLIETLIMLVVTAVVMMVVIPLSGQGVRGNFRLADEAVRSDERILSEAEYRRTLRQASTPLALSDGSVADEDIIGNALSVRFPVESGDGNGCAGAAGYAVVRMRIEQVGDGGRLLCEGAGAPSELLAWPAGEAGFTYSREGDVWSDYWPARRSGPALRLRRAPRNSENSAPLVRMTLSNGSRIMLMWIERAGEPPLRDIEEDGDAAPSLRGRAT